MPNAHSHAFQRGLRGRAERVARSGPRAGSAPSATDDFWSWREAMYAVAGELDPDSIEEAGRAAYDEMASAGYGAVGEFQYVHHRPDGRPYDDPNAMAKALARAARAAGLQIVLLPAAYARAGPGKPPEPRQRRFCDPTPDAFLARVDDLRTWAEAQPGVSVGIAAHSTRAVPIEWLEAIAEHSDEHGLVRHVHAAEQPRELEEIQAEHGCSPIELLERTGFLGPLASVVHAIHVNARDIELIWGSGATIVSCPTTEGNLGDGHPPLLEFRDAGIPIAIGSGSHVRIDPFEGARELETLARREGSAHRGPRRRRTFLAGHKRDRPAAGRPVAGTVEGHDLGEGLERAAALEASAGVPAQPDPHVGLAAQQRELTPAHVPQAQLAAASARTPQPHRRDPPAHRHNPRSEPRAAVDRAGVERGIRQPRREDRLAAAAVARRPGQPLPTEVEPARTHAAEAHQVLSRAVRPDGTQRPEEPLPAQMDDLAAVDADAGGTRGAQVRRHRRRDRIPQQPAGRARPTRTPAHTRHGPVSIQVERLHTGRRGRVRRGARHQVVHHEPCLRARPRDPVHEAAAQPQEGAPGRLGQRDGVPGGEVPNDEPRSVVAGIRVVHEPAPVERDRRRPCEERRRAVH